MFWRIPVILLIALPALLGCAEEPAKQAPYEAATHVIAPAAGYYESVPESGQQPDGQFPAGTKVEILEETEEYVKVRTGDGKEAYLLPQSVKKQTPEG